MLDGRLPTVSFRMHRQSKNAQHIVDGLAGHKSIEGIYYPALFTGAEQIRIRDAQCRFPGAMFSITLRGGKRAAFDFLRNLRIIKNAVSLGGVESLACHPATTTHSEMSAEDLVSGGIRNSLVRVSVGVEDWRDLLDDIRQALKKAG
jgi:cystathionine beta-lyase/cystathionine gamma-synthase